jgi:hypothetical protein
MEIKLYPYNIKPTHYCKVSPDVAAAAGTLLGAAKIATGSDT